MSIKFHSFYQAIICLAILPTILGISSSLTPTSLLSSNTNNIDTDNATWIKYSGEEKIALAKFRNLTATSLYRDYMKTDRYLIRWIRDANLDLEKASTKLRKFHQYRIQNRIDTILEEDMKSMAKSHPYQIIEASPKYGAGILLVSIGEWPLRRSMIINPAKVTRYVDFILESADVAVRASKNSSGTVIMDLNGFNLRDQACLACLPAIFHFVRNLEDYYPQILAAFHLINTPRVFWPIFDLVRPILSPYTRSILHFYGQDKSEWGPIVLKTTNIPPEILPVKYGGRR